MATTAVFAEILVIGLQVVVWLTLLIISVFGTDWIDLADVGDFASLLTVLVLAFAYVLGILVDRLADTLLDWFEKTQRGRCLKRRMSKNPVLATSEDVAMMRMTVMHKSDGMARFLDYQRSRWRIARATVINLAIAGPLAALYIAVGTDERLAWALVPLVSALALIPLTYFVGVRIQDAWVGRLMDAYAVVRRDTGLTPSVGKNRQVVAAVCYRRGQAGLELLLVRTKGGKHWTFPKGHVEQGEAPWEAAAREAREEAGVEGAIASSPFTTYLYPTTRHDEGESLVTAFLLEVERQGEPMHGECQRDPRWVGPDEAARLLGEGDREAKYAAEHACVVREAAAALSKA